MRQNVTLPATLADRPADDGRVTEVWVFGAVGVILWPGTLVTARMAMHRTPIDAIAMP